MPHQTAGVKETGSRLRTQGSGKTLMSAIEDLAWVLSLEP